MTWDVRGPERANGQKRESAENNGESRLLVDEPVLCSVVMCESNSWLLSSSNYQTAIGIIGSIADISIRRYWSQK